MLNLLAFFGLLIVIGACPLGMYIGTQRQRPHHDIFIGLIGGLLAPCVGIALAVAMGTYHAQHMCF